MDEQRTGDGRPLPTFLRREIGRRQYAIIDELIGETEMDCRWRSLIRGAPSPKKGESTTLGDARRGRRDSRRAAGRRSLSPSVREPTISGIVRRPGAKSTCEWRCQPRSRHRQSRLEAGKADARRAGVVLLRYQPESALSRWWRKRFASAGMRGRKVGIVGLARRLAIAFWRFLENGLLPEGATMEGWEERIELAANAVRRSATGKIDGPM